MRIERALLSDIRKLGAVIPLHVGGTSHHPLERLIADGRFREMNIFPIKVPPLHERKLDIPLLVMEMITHIEQDDRGSVRLSKKATVMLQQHSWPGNMRELGNLIERLAIQLPHGVLIPGICRQNISSLKKTFQQACLPSKPPWQTRSISSSCLMTVSVQSNT